MAKLYFKFGVMGSSKSAQALMCKYNYEQKGFKVLLLKPSLDTRDNTKEKNYVKSRIGLKSECYVFYPNTNLHEFILQKIKEENYSVVVLDEAQFCTKIQVEQLKEIADLVPVLCYGLKTNFQSYLFEGSKRFLEIADSITEIKAVCKCGKKASMNARIINGQVTTEGEEIVIGADAEYQSMCYDCWKKSLNK